MIEIKDLVKRYGSHTAVDHLNLTIEPGKIYGFLGPNGAGKSTTMNILTGYLGATEGEILINGHNLLEEPEEAKKCIGYLPELPPLYVDMTVREYLSFVSELKGFPAQNRKFLIEEAEKETGLTDVSRRLIRNLSKGYRQRVGLAQAIMGSPEIIILDEPTVGLDPKQIIEIRDLIRKLGEQHTVILSSHILSEIAEVCDRIFIISHGRLVAEDTTENLLAQMSSGSGKLLRLLVKGDRGLLEALLSQQDYIDKFTFSDAAGENIWPLEITVSGDSDPRESLFWLLAGNHLAILEMTAEKRSLEDVFLELTSDQNVFVDEAASGTNVHGKGEEIK